MKSQRRSVIAINVCNYHWITYNSIKDCRGVADILESGNANLDINNAMRLSVSYLMMHLTCLFLQSKKNRFENYNSSAFPIDKSFCKYDGLLMTKHQRLIEQ